VVLVVLLVEQEVLLVVLVVELVELLVVGDHLPEHLERVLEQLVVTLLGLHGHVLGLEPVAAVSQNLELLAEQLDFGRLNRLPVVEDQREVHRLHVLLWLKNHSLPLEEVHFVFHNQRHYLHVVRQFIHDALLLVLYLVDHEVFREPFVFIQFQVEH